MGILVNCLDCDEQFLTKNDLIQHTNSFHNKVKNKCKYCGKLFARKSNLCTHLKSMHEGKKYSCSQCDFKAKREGHLKQHLSHSVPLHWLFHTPYLLP